MCSFLHKSCTKWGFLHVEKNSAKQKYMQNLSSILYKIYCYHELLVMLSLSCILLYSHAIMCMNSFFSARETPPRLQKVNLSYQSSTLTLIFAKNIFCNLKFSFATILMLIKFERFAFAKLANFVFANPELLYHT